MKGRGSGAITIRLAELLPGDIVSFNLGDDHSMRPDLLISKRNIGSGYTEYAWLEIGTNNFHIERIKDVNCHEAKHRVLR